jgi:hypothetical protein
MISGCPLAESPAAGVGQGTRAAVELALRINATMAMHWTSLDMKIEPSRFGDNFRAAAQEPEKSA